LILDHSHLKAGSRIRYKLDESLYSKDVEITLNREGKFPGHLPEGFASLWAASTLKLAPASRGGVKTPSAMSATREATDPVTSLAF
jgi:hypothetical protein